MASQMQSAGQIGWVKSAWKNFDEKRKSRFDGAHENENSWINSGALVFGRGGGVFRRRSTDGNVEAERSKIKVHTRHSEIHHGDFEKYVREYKSHRGRHRRER